MAKPRRRDSRFIKLARQIKERDGWTCQRPGPRCTGSKNLEVHHIIPLHRGGPELDPNNCITLCHNDHMRVSRRPTPNRWSDRGAG